MHVYEKKKTFIMVITNNNVQPYSVCKCLKQMPILYFYNKVNLSM